MDASTKLLAEYLKERKTPLSAISDATGIPYNRLWLNLSESNSAKDAKCRGLKAGDFMLICNFIGKSPLDFYPIRDSA